MICLKLLPKLIKENDIVPLRKCQEILLEFGLTSAQARVYLAATQLGIAPVCKISQACNVRREDTYRALAKLEQMGIVEKIMDKPAQIRAQPPEEALTILTKNWKESASKKELSLTLKKQEFLKQFSAAEKLQVPKEEGHYALLLEKNIVFKKFVEMFKAAEREVDAITSTRELCSAISDREVPQTIQVFSETLRKQNGKPIKIRLILENPDSEKPQPINIQRYLPSNVRIELKYAFKPLSHYIIVDFKNVLLATSREPSMGTVPYLWTDTPDFAQLLQRNFEELWNASKSLQSS